MKILALERERAGTTATDFAPHLSAEAKQVWQLYQAGIIREMYFDQAAHTAVLMLECANLAEAEHLVATLPLVQAGFITFHLIPLAPYDGFSRLFAMPT